MQTFMNYRVVGFQARIVLQLATFKIKTFSTFLQPQNLNVFGSAFFFPSKFQRISKIAFSMLVQIKNNNKPLVRIFAFCKKDSNM